jgi:hypothetical protein
LWRHTVPVIECCSRQEWRDTFGNSFLFFQTIKLTNWLTILYCLISSVCDTLFFLRIYTECYSINCLFTYDIIEQYAHIPYLGFLIHTHTHIYIYMYETRQIDWRRLINEYFCLKLTLDYSSSLISCDSVYVYIYMYKHKWHPDREDGDEA